MKLCANNKSRILSAILFNRKTLKHNFLTKKLQENLIQAPNIWLFLEFKIYRNTIKDQSSAK